MPGGCSQLDAHRVVVPGRQGVPVVFARFKVHIHQAHPHRVVTALRRQRLPGGLLDPGQQRRRRLLGCIKAFCRFKGPGRFPQHRIPYLQLQRLILFAVTVGQDMQPQHILPDRVAFAVKARRHTYHDRQQQPQDQYHVPLFRHLVFRPFRSFIGSP